MFLVKVKKNSKKSLSINNLQYDKKVTFALTEFIVI